MDGSDDSPASRGAPVDEQPDRRGVLGRLAGIVMTGGLVASYGAFAAIAGRYLYPAHPRETAWLFVAPVAEFRPGDSLQFRAPDGATIVVARRASTGSLDDFIALSSTCPHLGCKVHWEAMKNRFVCPCHNGAFDPSGTATAGPPAEAGQSLARYPLQIEGGILFIEAPTERLAGGLVPAPRVRRRDNGGRPG